MKRHSVAHPPAITRTNLISRGRAMRLTPLAIAATILTGSPVPKVFAQSVPDVPVSVFGPSLGSGARGLGMGGAFVAVADDATAASWNPGGLTTLHRPEISLVGQTTHVQTDVSAYTFHCEPSCGVRFLDAPYSVNSKSLSPDFLSATLPFNLRKWHLVPQVSYQRVVDLGFEIQPYRRRIEGQSDPANFTSTFTDRATNSGGVDAITVSLGAQVVSWLSLGVSVDRWRNGGNEARTRTLTTTFSGDPSAPDRTGSVSNDIATVDGFSGTTVTLGALLKPVDRVTVGFVFRPSGQLDYDQTRTYQDTSPGGVRIELRSTGDLDWPRKVAGGLAVKMTSNWTLSSDYTWIGWKDVKLRITTVTTTTRSNSSTQTFSGFIGFPYEWFANTLDTGAHGPWQTNSSQLRFGTEYLWTNVKDFHLTAIAARAGIYRDRQTLLDAFTRTPVDYTGVTLGAGLVWSRVSVDLAYLHLSGRQHIGDFSTPAAGPTVPARILESDVPNRALTHRVVASMIVRF
jgi:long-chain fatty acid transport protein